MADHPGGMRSFGIKLKGNIAKPNMSQYTLTKMRRRARGRTTRTSIRPTAIAAVSGGAFVMSVSAAGEVFLAGNDSKSSKLFRRAVDGSMACTASIKLGRPNEPTGLCL
jgi:hypothetical protein